MNKSIIFVISTIVVVSIGIFLLNVKEVEQYSNVEVNHHTNQSSGVSKKRLAPTKTNDIVIDGIRFDAPKWGKSLGFDQNGGHLRAIDESTGEVLWVLQVYDIIYDGDIENDKLDRFITKISNDGQGRLLIDSERCGIYIVDIATQKVSIKNSPPCR